MAKISKSGLLVAAFVGVACAAASAEAQDVNRRSVKNFSEYRAEEQARMYEWYGYGRPQLIEPAAGPTVAMQTEPPARLQRWREDIGIKRYVPRLGSPERPFVIQVEPAPSSPVVLAPVR